MGYKTILHNHAKNRVQYLRSLYSKNVLADTTTKKLQSAAQSTN